MSGQFAGKIVAITGAAGGIGQALCRFFGAEGATHRGARPERQGRRAAPTRCGEDGIAVEAGGRRHRDRPRR